MKTTVILLAALLFTSLGYGQQMMAMKLIAAEELESPFNSMVSSVIPNNKTVLIMGGLNDWDGMNNYFNIYGSKVIIEKKDIASNGVINVVLRREDGENFYGVYPTLRAEITPITKTQEIY